MGEERPMTAIEDVIAERHRQIESEGWTPEHDDGHDAGELAMAGGCYALFPWMNVQQRRDFWPWDDAWWKPTHSRQDLVKAAALLIAEIERLDRSDAR